MKATSLIRNTAVALILVSALGCGNSGTKIHKVSGRVSLAGGDVSHLAGHLVEFSLGSDPNVRASGVIEPDGHFTLETLDGGKIHKGAREGTYQARIVLNDEGDGTLKLPPLARRYYQFQQSGLSIQVPATEEVQLKVSTK
jgi:hypothetical protein